MERKVHYIASSYKDLMKFPEGARSEAVFALDAAREGGRATCAIPMHGFGSAKILEVVIPEDGDAYRVVYTIKFRLAVYLLHAFQKKSKRGSKTPYQDVALVKSRLRLAEQHYREIYGISGSENEYTKKREER